MSTHEQYVTTLEANGAGRVMVVTANTALNPQAVESYIRQYKPFLKEGGTILTTGTVATLEGPVRLGRVSDAIRFAFTWME